MAKQKLVVIVGPTASGKTDLAITIAKQFQGEIISADSRQVYRGLDIGTAKITQAEMQGVPHHLIDIADVTTTYTAAQFKKDAEICIKEIANRDHLPIIAGGTFFYVDTLLGTTSSPSVSPNPQLRELLEERSVTELYEELKIKDPRRAAEIDPQNKRRLIRALEIIEAIGAVPPAEPKASPYDVLTLGLKTDYDSLRQRLEKRANLWLKNGFLDEVRALLDKNILRKRIEEIGFEYLIGVDVLEGNLNQEKFVEVFVQKNWQYAKRQLTWLQRNKNINWVSPSDRSEIEITVMNFLMN